MSRSDNFNFWMKASVCILFDGIIKDFQCIGNDKTVTFYNSKCWSNFMRNWSKSWINLLFCQQIRKVVYQKLWGVWAENFNHYLTTRLSTIETNKLVVKVGITFHPYIGHVHTAKIILYKKSRIPFKWFNQHIFKP